MMLKEYTPDEILENADEIVIVNIYDREAEVYSLNGAIKLNESSIDIIDKNHIAGLYRKHVSFSEFGGYNGYEIFCLRKDVEDIVNLYRSNRLLILSERLQDISEMIDKTVNLKIVER